MRCSYCLPDGAPPPRPRAEILSFEEIERIARVGASLGIRRLRLTGGEPLLRRDLPALVRLLRRIDGVGEIALTTNGLLLDAHLDDLVAAGVDSIHVSLDSADPETFHRLTGADPAAIGTILAVVRRCRRIAPHVRLGLNAVVVRGTNDAEVEDLAALGRDLGVEVRYIEFMPFAGVEWSADRVVAGAEVAARVAARWPAREAARSRAAAPARRFAYEDGGSFAVIEPVTRPFCAACDRLRLRSDGRLYNCLFDAAGVDLRGPLRAGASDAEIAGLFRACVAAKGLGGALEIARQAAAPARVMAEIGG